MVNKELLIQSFYHFPGYCSSHNYTLLIQMLQNCYTVNTNAMLVFGKFGVLIVDFETKKNTIFQWVAKLAMSRFQKLQMALKKGVIGTNSIFWGKLNQIKLLVF